MVYDKRINRSKEVRSTELRSLLSFLCFNADVPQTSKLSPHSAVKTALTCRGSKVLVKAAGFVVKAAKDIKKGIFRAKQERDLDELHQLARKRISLLR